MKIDLDAERREADRVSIEIVVGGDTFSIEEPVLEDFTELLALQEKFDSSKYTDEDLDRLFAILFGSDAGGLKKKVRISEIQGLIQRVFEWISDEREKKAEPAAESRDGSPAGSPDSSEETRATGSASD